MAGLRFDITADNQNFIKKYNETNKAIIELGRTADLQSGRIDKVFNSISLKGLERIHELMQGFPKEIQGLESFKKQMADLEKRLEQANKKIIELQNQARQPITIQTNTSEVVKETFAYDSLLESLNDILGARGQNISAILQEQNAIRINQRELKVLQELEGKGLKLSDAQQTRRIQLTNSIMQHKQAISSLQQVINNEVKLEQVAVGSMEEMNQSLGRMRMAYRQLSEEGRNSKFGQDLLIGIQEADSKIKQLDASIGNHQREVGNYKQKWDGLGMSIQQIGREFPSLAYGPKVFFSAISNNLPILADELKRAKNEFNALKAEGKAATPVWKQVVSSLFSWNTALTVGVTLLTLYGDKLVDWVSGLFDAKDAVKKLLSAEQEMALARKAAWSDIAKEHVQLDVLYKKLKDVTLSTSERNLAISVWIGNYKKHSDIMDGENISLDKLNKAYASLSKEIYNNAVARKYADKAAEISIRREEGEVKLNYQKKTTGDLQTSLNMTEKAYQAMKEKYGNSDNFEEQQALLRYEMAVTTVRNKLNSQLKIEEELKNSLIGINDEYQIFVNHINRLQSLNTPKEGTYDYWQQQIQNADSALKQIDSKQRKLLNAGLTEGIPQNVIDQYKQAIKLKSEAEKALKVYEDPSKQDKSSDTLRKEQEKYNLLMDKQKREAARMKTDSQHELEQIEIDGLKEGSEKVLRQRALNHEKELETIKREAEDKKLKEIEAARSAFEANPANAKKTFNVKKDFTDLQSTKNLFASFDKTAEAKTKTENTKYNRGDDFKGLLDEHQDYTDKRLAIETKYNNDLATLEEQRKQAVKDGDTKQVEQIDRAKAQATKNKGMELMGMDYDKLKESPDYVRAFENLKETSSETLNSLLSQLENAKQTAAKVLSPDQLREYTSTIQSIMDELDSRNPFQSLSDNKKELAEAEQALADAQMSLENARQTAEAVKGGAQIENGVTSSKFNEKTGKIDSTKAYLTEAQALEKVKEKTDSYNEAKDKTTKASAKVQTAEKKVASVIGELGDSLKGLGSAIGGQAGEIIGLIGDIGTFAMTAMNGVGTASTTASSAIKAVEKASVILAIISAAIQIATKIASIFKDDDGIAQYEKAKETYESYINILDRVIDKHLELAKTLSGENADAAYQKAINTVKLQSEDAKTLGRQYLNSGASKGFLGIGSSASKGRKEVEDMSWEGWNQAANALGMSVDQFKNKMGGRMEGLFDLTDEQLVKLQGDAGIFWSQLDSDTQKYVDQVAGGVSKITEILEQQIADKTLLDVSTLRSDFRDLLTDMDSDSADFADNFEGYMKNAIINSMLKDQYTGQLTAWRKKFYNAMESGVSEDEYNDLKEEGQRISDEMLAKRKELAEMYGWNDEDDEREASKKGFASMSQDSADELNGRFTVIQGHTYEINGSVKAIQSDTAKIAEKLSFLTNMDKNMSDMVRGHDVIVAHLSNIEGYTANLVEMRQFMYYIKLGIDTLNTKGITLKR